MKKQITKALGILLTVGMMAGEFTGYQTANAATRTDYYTVATDISATDVENFAKSVKENVINGKWEELSKQISYPVLIGKKNIKTAEDFIKYAKSGTVNEVFLKAIKAEDCTDMFCNSEGITFGNGEIWFAEDTSEQKGLKIISFSEFIDSAKVVVAKPIKIKWKKVTKKDSDAAGVRATWKKVKKADGYQCRFYLFWSKDKKSYEKKTVKKNSASVYFQDNENIKLKVRAYRKVNGEKVYSKWATSIIKKKKIEKLNK